MKILITGATGLVGKKLVSQLHTLGHEIIIITRDKLKAKVLGCDSCKFIEADLVKSPLPYDLIDGVDAVINLMGESIASGYWTKSRKKAIYQSRIEGTQNLIASLKTFPKIYIGASAIGFYGDRGDEALTEQSKGGDGFLAQVCQDWEKEHEKIKVASAQTRTIILRIGVVLSPAGGFLEQVKKIFNLNLGSPLGTGSQWLSWVDVNDLVNAIVFCLNNPSISGPVNLVSPNPITNKKFSEIFAKRLNKVLLPSAPAVLIKLGLGDMAELLLNSQRVVPEKLLKNNFDFKILNIEEAVNNVKDHLE